MGHPWWKDDGIDKHLLRVVIKHRKTGEETIYDNVVDVGHFHGNDGSGYKQYFRILVGVHEMKREEFIPEDFDITITMMKQEEINET